MIQDAIEYIDKELTRLRDQTGNSEPSPDQLRTMNTLLDLSDMLEGDDGQDANPDMTAALRAVQLDPVGGRRTMRTSKPMTLHGPDDNKSYRSLFGDSGREWEDRDMTFFEALFSGRAHPGLVKRAMNETVGSGGGFLVPTEYEKQIHDVSLENEIVAPLANVMPMDSKQLEIPAFEIGDHSSHLYGGFIAYYKGEATSLTEADPQTRRMELNARKLTGYVKLSNELIEDSGSHDKITQICGEGLAWYRDRAFLKGNGANQPLGVLNANCLKVVSKETGQAASTIVYANLANMLGALFPGSFNRSVWVCHVTTIPQLLQLTIPAGTGGSHYPVLTSSQGKFEILHRPAVFTEKTEALGTQGDVLLADFSQYVIGLKRGMRIDHSIHVAFSTDELVTRLIERHDGQPLWDKVLTLEDGSNTVSPFVTLEDR
jgi:HK97 family phage major capsid protein